MISLRLPVVAHRKFGDLALGVCEAFPNRILGDAPRRVSEIVVGHTGVPPPGDPPPPSRHRDPLVSVSAWRADDSPRPAPRPLVHVRAASHAASWSRAASFMMLL